MWVLCTGQCDITESLGCCFTTAGLFTSADGEQSNFTLLFSQTPLMCSRGLFWSCTGKALNQLAELSAPLQKGGQKGKM